MVLPLVILALVIYVSLWLSDIHLTLKTVGKSGHGLEGNPIMRRLLGMRRRYLWSFKALEMGVFLYLIFYLTNFADGSFVLIPLLVYMVVYAIIFANNSKITFLETGKDSSITYMMVVLLTVALVMLIYLNYNMYQDLSVSYNKLLECKSSLTACSG
jgi:hypothetical protein